MRMDRLRPWAIVPLRVVVGVGFVVHGYAKWTHGPANFGNLLQQIGVPLPLPTAWLVTGLEFFGGIALIIGIGVSLAALPLMASMFVAMVQVQARYGFSSVNTIGLTQHGPVFGPPGYEINLLYIAALAALAVLGPGPLSVARGIGGRETEHRRSRLSR
ncbi:MAG TPA: DoxX family membrane protein [Gemmatimonadaceae bacterium]